MTERVDTNDESPQAESGARCRVNWRKCEKAKEHRKGEQIRGRFFFFNKWKLEGWETTAVKKKSYPCWEFARLSHSFFSLTWLQIHWFLQLSPQFAEKAVRNAGKKKLQLKHLNSHIHENTHTCETARMFLLTEFLQKEQCSFQQSSNVFSIIHKKL